MSDAPNPEPATTAPVVPTGESVSASSPPVAPNLQPYDFRQSSLLSPRQLRKLRAHETQFLSAMEARMALFLRAEFPVKLAGIDVVNYQKLIEGWVGPTHLVLFKTEPLRGVSVLEIPLNLGLTVVDRLMGGPGKVEPVKREISEIEKALLDQMVQIILEEWCNNWAVVKPLKPSVLGCESTGRYLQSAPSQTNMLVLSIDARFNESSGQIKLVTPYTALEPSLRQLCGGNDPSPVEAPVAAAAAPVKWNRCLDDVVLPITAEWHGLQLSAREILNLKVGDVLQVDPQVAGRVSLRFGEKGKFNGRLGTVAGRWAVELTETMNL
jgi:flagellar motor switch protein FliM